MTAMTLTPVAEPLTKARRIANELHSLGDKYTRLPGANGDHVADLLIADTHRLAEALVEELDLMAREASEARIEAARYKGDADIAQSALTDIAWHAVYAREETDTRFRDAWHKANEAGELGGRSTAGMTAALAPIVKALDEAGAQ